MPAVAHLDWKNPTEMLIKWPECFPNLPQNTFDFIIGTELIYTKEGAEYLINTVKAWLKPGGQFYLLQNGLRAGLEHFTSLLNGSDTSDTARSLRAGLVLEELDCMKSTEIIGRNDTRVTQSLAEGTADEDLLRFFRITKSPLGSDPPLLQP